MKQERVGRSVRTGVLKRDSAVLAFFLVLSLIGTYPLVTDISGRIAGSGADPLLNAFIMNWGAYALLRSPTKLFEAPFFYPFPSPLAYSDHLLGLSLVGGTMGLISGNPALGLNLALILSFWLSSFGMYKLISEFTGDALPGVLAGVVFAYCSFRYSHISRIHLLSSQWIPFTLFYLIRYLRGGGRGNLIAFGGFHFVSVITGWYQAVFTLVAVAIVLLVYFARTRRVVISGVFMCIATSPCIFVSLPYLRVRKLYPDITPPVTVMIGSSASVLEYLVPSKGNVLYERVLGLGAGALASPSSPRQEHSLFPGMVSIVLCLLLLLMRGSRSGATLCFALIAVSGFILSLGPMLRIWREPTPVPLPLSILSAFLVPFRIVRYPSRYAVLTMLGVSGLTGVSLSLLKGRLNRLYVPLSCLLITFAFLEGIEVPVEASPFKLKGSGALAYLRTRKGERAVLDFDRAFFEGDWLAMPCSMLRAIYHRKPIVNGFSGYKPKEFDQLRRVLSKFPSPDALSVMRQLAIRWVVFHPSEFSKRFSDRLRQRALLLLDKDFGDEVIYDVRRSGVRWLPREVSVSVLSPSVTSSGERFTIGVKLTNGGGSPAVFRPPKDRILVRVEETEEAVTTPAPLVLLPGESRIKSVTLRAPAREDKLHLTAIVRNWKSMPCAVRISGRFASTEKMREGVGRFCDFSVRKPVVCGQEFQLFFTISNRGETIWRARPPERFTMKPHAIALVVWRAVGMRVPRFDRIGTVLVGVRYIEDISGGVITEPVTRISPIPHDVSPGESLRMSLKLRAPGYTGLFRYHLALGILGSDRIIARGIATVRVSR